MATKLTDVEQALQSIANGNGDPQTNLTSNVCRHCGAFSQHAWGWTNAVGVTVGQRTYGRNLGEPHFLFALCAVCQHETVLAKGKVIYPTSVSAPVAAKDMPPEIASDFEEARQIVGASPRGAAALLRLAIQKLCPVLGAAKGDINAAIGELVASGKISAVIQQALDSVRVVGNEAVHPGTIDFHDDPTVAHALFGLVNFIVEKAITEPKEIDAIYQSLPAGKLAGIAQRDTNKP